MKLKQSLYTIVITLIPIFIFSIRMVYAQEQIDTATQSHGMHACPEGEFMIGANISTNTFLCTDYIFPKYTSSQEFVDGDNEPPTQNNGMHTCPDGTAMIGLHVGNNWLLCAPVPVNILPKFVDGDNEPPTQNNGMHACPKGWVMLGIHVGNNYFLCGQIEVAPIASLNVELYLDQIAVNQISDTGSGNTRDEYYVLISGSTPSGMTSLRLPRNDDYYEGFAGSVDKANPSDISEAFTNQDQLPMGAPIIWGGTLADGQFANFLVVICEQDNKDAKALLNGLRTALDTVGTILPDYTSIAQGAKQFLTRLNPSDQDDVIGAFYVEVKNNSGTLQTTFFGLGNMDFGALGTATTEQDLQDSYAQSLIVPGQIEAAGFSLNGTGNGVYRAEVVARTVTGTPHKSRIYLSEDTGRCSKDSVQVGSVQVNDREIKDVYVKDIPHNNSEFGWSCGDDSGNRTNLNTNADVIVVWHWVNAPFDFGGSRLVKFLFFREVN